MHVGSMVTSNLTLKVLHRRQASERETQKILQAYLEERQIAAGNDDGGVQLQLSRIEGSLRGVDVFIPPLKGSENAKSDETSHGGKVYSDGDATGHELSTELTQTGKIDKDERKRRKKMRRKEERKSRDEKKKARRMET